MPTTYPVDSTYHACCQAIGARHARDCATLTPPAGVTVVGDFDNENERPLYGHRHLVGDVTVTAVALQNGRGEIDAHPTVQVLGDGELSPRQARQLAAALVAAADQADEWERVAAKHRHPAGRAQLTLI